MKTRKMSLNFLLLFGLLLGVHPAASFAQPPSSTKSKNPNPSDAEKLPVPIEIKPLRPAEDVVARSGDKGHAGTLDNDGDIRLFIEERLKIELTRTTEWIDHLAGFRVKLDETDKVFQWEIQELVRKGLLYDVKKSKYLIAEDEPECREKMADGQVAMALPGRKGGMICWSLKAILGSSDARRTEANLVGLAFHEHYHHFESRSVKASECGDKHGRKQAKFERLHLERVADEKSRGNGFVYLVSDRPTPYSAESNLLLDLKREYTARGYNVIEKSLSEYREVSHVIEFDAKDIVIHTRFSTSYGNCFISIEESSLNSDVVTLKEEMKSCEKARRALWKRIVTQKRWEAQK